MRESETETDRMLLLLVDSSKGIEGERERERDDSCENMFVLFLASFTQQSECNHNSYCLHYVSI